MKKVMYLQIITLIGLTNIYSANSEQTELNEFLKEIHLKWDGDLDKPFYSNGKFSCQKGWFTYKKEEQLKHGALMYRIELPVDDQTKVGEILVLLHVLNLNEKNQKNKNVINEQIDTPYVNFSDFKKRFPQDKNAILLKYPDKC